MKARAEVVNPCRVTFSDGCREYTERMGIRIDGTTGENVVSCMSCGEVIYPDAQCIAFQTIWNLPDGRTAVYSNAFGRTIHLCSPEQMAEQVETVISEATSLLV